ncbi:MAG TPA: hypothetical protein VGM67_05720 [Gemmatimonadaceae bacterium]|jgi:hypothetical protein
MRRALLLLLLCGCASAGSTSTDAVTAAQPVIASDDHSTILGDAPTSTAADIAAPPLTVWAAVKKVYADMSIPVTLENTAGHQLGNRNFYKTHSIAGQSMTDFVDCGSGMTGPNASSWRIYISSITVVQPNSKGGTNIQTVFVPTGQDISGTSSDRIPCATTGRFEALFLRKVQAAVGN